VRVVLGLVARADNESTRESRNIAINNAIRHAKTLIKYAFPTRPEDITLETWRSLDGGVALLTWHNEAAIEPGITQMQNENGAVALVGYSAEMLKLEPLLRTGDLLALSSTFSGCFSFYRANNSGVEAVTDATRSNGVYWAESPSLRVVSSRALLSHLIQQTEIQKSEDPALQMNLVGIRHMALSGYFLANHTPYIGVDALSVTESIRIDSWFSRRTQMPIWTPDKLDISSGIMNQLVQDIAAALVRAFDPISGTDLNLALTGGRDSRLLAAALMNRPDIRVNTSTMGIDDDPDVVIARLISRIMGVKHQVAAPRGMVDQTLILAEEPLSRIVRVLDVHDAMTSGWDDIIDYGPMMTKQSISGVGGEILRGGLVFTELDALEPAIAVERLTKLLTGGNFFAEQYNESARALAAPIIHMAKEDPYRAIDDFYYNHRNGRWVSARRAGARFRTRVYDPLLDNQFVRLVKSIPSELRWQERLAFDILTTLAPPLRDLPIEGQRWRFERSRPDANASSAEYASWEQRGRLVRSARTASYSWQRLEHQAVRSSVRSLILDGLSGPAASLFDRKLVEAYLQPEKYAYPTVVWHIATAVVMLSTPWYKTQRQPRTLPIEIRLNND